MNEKLTTRETTEEDKERVLALSPQAFPEEELRPLVSSLLDEDTGVLSAEGIRLKRSIGEGPMSHRLPSDQVPLDDLFKDLLPFPPDSRRSAKVVSAASVKTRRSRPSASCSRDATPRCAAR